MKETEYEFPEVVDFWPDYLRQQELQSQKQPSQEDCDNFEWEDEDVESRG